MASDPEPPADWLGRFSAEFGRRFGAVYGPLRSWRWTLESSAHPTVIMTRQGSQPLVISEPLPRRFFQFPPDLIAARLWEQLMARAEVADHD